MTDAPTSVSSEDGLIDCGPRTRLTVTPTISKEDRSPSTGTIWADKPFDYNIRLRFDERSLKEEFRIKVDEQPTAFISLAICPYQILEDIESQPCHALHRRNITESHIEMDDFFSGQEDMVVVDQPTSPLQILSVSSIDPIPLERREEHSELFLETTIQTSFDVVGNYYLIAVASILVQNEAEQEMKMTITNNPQASIYTFDQFVELNMSSKQAQILSYGVTAASIAFEFFILVSLVRNRNHNIMKVSQVSFLIAFLVMGILAIILGIFLSDVNDLFCNLRILVNIPLAAMYAILIARLWRIDAITTPVMGNTFTGNGADPNYQGPFLLRLLSFIAEGKCPATASSVLPNRGPRRRSSYQSVRRTITNTMLVRIILVLVAPFVAIDTFLIAYGVFVETFDSEAESYETPMCSNSVSVKRMVYFIAFLMLQILTVFVAYMTKELPSVVNESEAIFRSTWVNLMFAFAFSLLILMEPTAPNVELLSLTFVTICYVSSMTWFIIVPKLKVVWSGQNINIQQELHMHQQYRRGSAVSSPDNFVRRRSWHDQFPLSLQNGMVKRSKHFNQDINVNMGGNEDKLYVSKEGHASRRILTQIISTMDICEKVCEDTNARRPLTKTDWETFRVRTGALYNQLSEIQFSWNDDDSEDMSFMKSENHNFDDIPQIGSSSGDLLCPQQISTLSSSETEEDFKNVNDEKL